MPRAQTDSDAYDPDSVGLPATEGGVGDEVLDLSGYDENAGPPPLAPGVYDARVDNAEWGISQSGGNPMITWTFVVQDHESGRERRVWHYSVLTEDHLGRLKRLIRRLNPDYDLTQFRPRSSAADFIGSPCRLRLRVQAGRGDQGPRNQVSDVLPPDEGSSSFLDA